MRWKAVSGIMLTLFLTSMLTLVFNIQTVKAEPTTIIVDGNPDDWSGISPSVYHTVETGDWLDVKALYVTSDSSNLYIRVDTMGSIQEDFWHRFQGRVRFDTDEDGQADCAIGLYIWYGSGVKVIHLYEVINHHWQLVENPSFLEIAAKRNVLEMGIGLSDIGNPTQIDIMFKTENNIDEWCNMEEAPLYFPLYFTYVLGQTIRNVVVDGGSSDWIGIAAGVADEKGEINPPYYDMTYAFAVDDANQLYFRVDVASSPKTQISGLGWLQQTLFVYLDTDYNRTTGLNGAEYLAQYDFKVTPEGNQVTSMYLLKWDGEEWQKVPADLSAALDEIFEASVALTNLGLTSEESIDISTRITAYLFQDLGHIIYTFEPMPPGMSADLARRGAWPEHHRFVLTKDGDPSVDDRHGTPGDQTLYGMVKNTGNTTVPSGTYKVVWNISDSRGSSRIVETVGTVDLAPGETTVLTYNVSAIDLAPDKYYVEARCCYYCTLEGEKIKAFSFTVVS